MTREHKSSPVLTGMKFRDREASWTHTQGGDSTTPAPGTLSSPTSLELLGPHFQPCTHISSLCSRSWLCCVLSRLRNLPPEWGLELGQTSKTWVSQSPGLSLLTARSIQATNSGGKDVEWRGSGREEEAFSVITSGLSYSRPSAPCYDRWRGEETERWLKFDCKIFTYRYQEWYILKDSLQTLQTCVCVCVCVVCVTLEAQMPSWCRLLCWGKLLKRAT